MHNIYILLWMRRLFHQVHVVIKGWEFFVFIQTFTLSGTLSFVDLDTYITGTLPRGDDTYATVSVDDGLNFGDTIVYFVNVCCIITQCRFTIAKNASDVLNGM